MKKRLLFLIHEDQPSDKLVAERIRQYFMKEESIVCDSVTMRCRANWYDLPNNRSIHVPDLVVYCGTGFENHDDIIEQVDKEYRPPAIMLISTELPKIGTAIQTNTTMYFFGLAEEKLIKFECGAVREMRFDEPEEEYDRQFPYWSKVFASIDLIISGEAPEIHALQ